MKILILSIALISPIIHFAQTAVKPQPLVLIEPAGTDDGRVSGQVIDASTNQPVEYATVSVKSLDDSTFFTGGLTADGGKFNIDKLKPGKYEVKVSFLGYENISRQITIDSKKNNINLGTIKISADSKLLNEVEVTARKQDMMVGIDRKVFDVEKNAITTGGTAIDVLRQIPTLQVDIDGNISLRGSDNITIFINGKNTGMSGRNLTQVLKSMPASSIKNVELITNPSAKYDAAGMSGIINIITKKNLAPGNFGSATISAGNRDKYSANGSWNYRKEKFSSSMNLGGNYMKFQMSGFNKRDNFYTDSPDFSVNNNRKGEVVNDGVNLSGNIDYTFNPKNSLGLNYMVGYGRGRMHEANRYEFLDSARNTTRLYERHSNNNFVSPSTDVGLTYTKNLGKTEKKNELVIFSNMSVFTFDDNQNYLQQEMTLTGEAALLKPSDQHNDLLNKSRIYTNQADYTLGIGASGKLEAGLKSNIRKINDEFIADTLNNTTGLRERNANLSNKFQYDEIINAAYLNYAGTIGKWGYQGGLRAEQTVLEIFQAAVNPAPIKRDYTNLFPSVFVSRKWEKQWETQLSYSRRINRPNSWFLNPFPDLTDPLNTRSGNPYLNPEFINAYELSISKYWTSHSLTFTNFYRQINNVFQRIREVDNEGVSRVSFNNFGSSKNMGTEIVLRNKITSAWTNTTNLNLYRTVLQGQTAIRDYATDAFNWNIRIMSSFRFWKNADIQLSAFYMAPFRIPQGHYYGFSGADLGFRKDVLDGRGSLGINVQDIFNTRKFRVTTEDFNYKGETQFKRESQWVMMNFTWKFGNPGEGQQNMRRTRRNVQNQGGQDMNIGL